MGSAWLGLLGVIAGGLVSLTGTLITTRLQWRQERARWSEQREHDLLQWQQQRETETAKLEIETRRETLAWQRTRDDDHVRWIREQKIKCYLDALDHLLVASELAANAVPARSGEDRPYAREDEMAIAQELKRSYRWVTSASAVCGDAVTERLKKLSADIYFTMQAVSYEGMEKGGMVRRPEGGVLKKWLLSESVDTMSARLSEIMRADLSSA
jgi:hypothetical protein